MSEMLVSKSTKINRRARRPTISFSAAEKLRKREEKLINVRKSGCTDGLKIRNMCRENNVAFSAFPITLHTHTSLLGIQFSR